jgi:hypothetical protein
MSSVLKLVEERSGVGVLLHHGEVLRQVRYSISRYQGIIEANGMPLPGLFRLEGSIDVDANGREAALIGLPLTLRLEDGRALAVTLLGLDGRILAEGHGPSRCMCC